MGFVEYPKALYLGGDPAQDCRTVTDAEQERAARAENYRGAWEAAGEANAVPVEPVRRKRKTGDA